MAGEGALRGDLQPWFLARGGLAAAVPFVVALAACGSDKLVNVREGYEVVGGAPSIDPSIPTVQKADGAKPGDFASNAPSGYDSFRQTDVPQVDILWVIDDSESMQPKQDKLKANFDGFMRALEAYQARLDYHIGVITTDTTNPNAAGKLQNKAGLSRPWISRDTCAGACRPADAFARNASVGTAGSFDEKPLLAASLALTAPLATTGANAGFLRREASLFVVFLTDEEDSSCSPSKPDGGGCLPPLAFGEVDYFARFFEGLKGFGNGQLVTVGSIVALAATTPIPNGNGRMGCQMAGVQLGSLPKPAFAFADHAPRLVEVARRTGGLAVDVCSGDYAGALANLGFLATGAKSSFFLSRAPFPQDLRVYVTKAGGAREPQRAGVDFDYVPCVDAGAAVKNAVEFRPGAVPPPGALVEVDYSVNVRGVRCPP